MKILKKIWLDSVGSKIIASIIIGIATLAWSLISAFFNNITFETALIEFWTIKLELWIIILAIVLFSIGYSVIRNYFSGRKFKYDEETLQLDRELFEKIRQTYLPQDTTIYFLRNFNFAGFSFDRNKVDSIFEFEEKDKNSDFEFLNPELEGIKQELSEKISKFTNLIAFDTFPTEKGFQTVPPEWEDEQPERFREVVNKFHTSKHEICDKYDELIKTGRSILKV